MVQAIRFLPLDLPRNAVVFAVGDLVVARHYDTDVLIYDKKTKKFLALWPVTPTSAQVIWIALQWLNVTGQSIERLCERDLNATKDELIETWRGHSYCVSGVRSFAERPVQERVKDDVAAGKYDARKLRTEYKATIAARKQAVRAR